jgi:hypothetical protein
VEAAIELLAALVVADVKALGILRPVLRVSERRKKYSEDRTHNEKEEVKVEEKEEEKWKEQKREK